MVFNAVWEARAAPAHGLYVWLCVLMLLAVVMVESFFGTVAQSVWHGWDGMAFLLGAR